MEARAVASTRGETSARGEDTSVTAETDPAGRLRPDEPPD
jgi:hypothetical protein